MLPCLCLLINPICYISRIYPPSISPHCPGRKNGAHAHFRWAKICVISFCFNLICCNRLITANIIIMRSKPKIPLTDHKPITCLMFKLYAEESRTWKQRNTPFPLVWLFPETPINCAISVLMTWPSCYNSIAEVDCAITWPAHNSYIGAIFLRSFTVLITYLTLCTVHYAQGRLKWKHDYMDTGKCILPDWPCCLVGY